MLQLIVLSLREATMSLTGLRFLTCLNETPNKALLLLVVELDRKTIFFVRILRVSLSTIMSWASLSRLSIARLIIRCCLVPLQDMHGRSSQTEKLLAGLAKVAGLFTLPTHRCASTGDNHDTLAVENHECFSRSCEIARSIPGPAQRPTL